MPMKKYTSPFAKFVSENSGSMSLVAVANGVGISSSYLSELLSGKKDPSIEVCNKIASYFHVPKIQVYKLAGLIDDDSEDELLEYLIEMVNKDPDFKELAKLYTKFNTPEDKRRAISVLKLLVEDKK
jgi:transcriptional regulator with XRE-family HTH domain